LKGRFDLIINTVSAGIDWNQYLSLLALDGSMVVVGLPETKVPIAPFALVGHRRSLSGSAIGGIRETQEMLDFCGRRGITCDIEVVPIQGVNEAYERVLKSDVRYRFVIDLASLRRG
jgi:alcohol dehydrogenase (NADP+)